MSRPSFVCSKTARDSVFIGVMTRMIPLFLLGTVLTLSSCSHAFHKEWRQALKNGAEAGVEGAWEGNWKSEVNGHHGRLRSVVGPAKNTEGDHSFHYHATWAGILSGSYRADHRVQQTKKDLWSFDGEHRMPAWAGGLYTYKGTIEGDSFQAGYECSNDRGTFQMKRVKSHPAP